MRLSITRDLFARFRRYRTRVSTYVDTSIGLSLSLSFFCTFTGKTFAGKFVCDTRLSTQHMVCHLFCDTERTCILASEKERERESQKELECLYLFHSLDSIFTLFPIDIHIRTCTYKCVTLMIKEMNRIIHIPHSFPPTHTHTLSLSLSYLNFPSLNICKTRAAC